MAAQYIPAGRTSLVTWGKATYQLQTEYAAMPQPRITTTIFTQGKVIHKIERTINRAVGTIEEMHLVEDIIKKQHLEIARIIREKGLPTQRDRLPLKPKREVLRSERIRQLAVVERVFLITGEGKLIGDHETSPEFKQAFKHIIRALPELINVFASLPGRGERREEGVYEVEPGRILMASAGVEFYLILVKQGTAFNAVAGDIREILQV